MNTASILIKTDPELKTKAQKTAKELGLSLSSILNGFLKQFIKSKTITFSANDEEPSEFLLETLKKSEEQLKNGEVSPTFTNAKDAIDWLHKQTE